MIPEILYIAGFPVILLCKVILDDLKKQGITQNCADAQKKGMKIEICDVL